MSPTSRENGRKTWRGPRRWDIHTSALLIFRRLEVSRKTMEIRAFSSALADGIEISLRRRNPIVGARGIRDSFLPISESFPLSPRERFAADLELGRIPSIVQWTPIRNLHCYKLITRSSLVVPLCPREAGHRSRYRDHFERLGELEKLFFSIPSIVSTRS